MEIILILVFIGARELLKKTKNRNAPVRHRVSGIDIYSSKRLDFQTRSVTKVRQNYEQQKNEIFIMDVTVIK